MRGPVRFEEAWPGPGWLRFRESPQPRREIVRLRGSVTGIDFIVEGRGAHHPHTPTCTLTHQPVKATIERVPKVGDNSR